MFEWEVMLCHKIHVFTHYLNVHNIQTTFMTYNFILINNSWYDNIMMQLSPHVIQYICGGGGIVGNHAYGPSYITRVDHRVCTGGL